MAEWELQHLALLSLEGNKTLLHIPGSGTDENSKFKG
jgi:hypothetical protein